MNYLLRTASQTMRPTTMGDGSYQRWNQGENFERKVPRKIGTAAPKRVPIPPKKKTHTK